MSDDREKLLQIMSSLEKDYRSGKISAEKYSYFRSKYEDKLNTIDAQAATKRIRSMQGKPADNKRKKRSRRPTNNKKKQEQDLVQKYIINPKKGDAKYNKKEKSSMDGGTFKLFLLLVLVIAFTAGVAYGIFNFDFDTLSNTNSVAVVQDTAFPEIANNTAGNTNSSTQTSYTNYNSSGSSSSYSSSNVETTSTSSTYDSGPTASDNTYSQSSSSGSSSSESSSSSSSDSGSGSQSSSSGSRSTG